MARLSVLGVLIAGCAAPGGAEPDPPAPTPAVEAPAPAIEAHPAPAVDALPAPIDVAQLEPIARALFERGIVTGYTVGVIQEGHHWVRGYGEARPGARAGPDTVFATGSITKTFTAVLYRDAVERGEIAANATVGDVYPEEAPKLPPEKAALPLVRLANHTSGLPRMPPTFAPKNPLDPYADFDRSMLWRALREAKLGPRTYLYSNLGFALLGELVAHRAGLPYRTLLRQRVLQPLTLDEVRLDPRPADARAHRAPGVPTPDWHFRAFAPAGAVRASVPDLLAWIEAHLEAQYLGPPSLADALRGVIEPTAPFGAGHVGGGWHIDSHGVRWHNGQTGGFHGFLGFDPLRGHGVAILANTACSEVDDVGFALLATIRGVPARSAEPARPDRPDRPQDRDQPRQADP